MKRTNIFAMATLGLASLALAGSQSSTTYVALGRSEAGAITSILSRLSADEGRALLHTLLNLENKNVDGDASRAYGFAVTEEIIIGNTDPDKRETVRGAWSKMGNFDKESFTILARDAYFGGIDDGQPRGALLNKFLSDRNMRPFGTNVMPEQVILNNLVSKMDNRSGELFRNAIVALDRRGLAGEFRNFGYVNAEQTLVAAIPEGDRETFVGSWARLDYSDREACLTLVRDAALGGLADL